MPLDLTKYLAMKPAIDADILLAAQAVKDAEAARKISDALYDSTVTTLNNLQAVQRMLTGLVTVTPAPNPNIVPVTDIPPPIV